MKDSEKHRKRNRQTDRDTERQRHRERKTDRGTKIDREMLKHTEKTGHLSDNCVWSSYILL